ncbi:MAG: hypothetical protein WBK86_07585 [Halanaerobiales bacterium]
MKRIQYLNEEHNEYISLAFVALRRTIPQDIRRDLIERGLHEDLEAEIILIAFEGMKKYPKDKEYLNFAGRCLYRFLRNHGYRRPKGYHSYIREEIGLHEYR